MQSPLLHSSLSLPHSFYLGESSDGIHAGGGSGDYLMLMCPTAMRQAGRVGQWGWAVRLLPYRPCAKAFSSIQHSAFHPSQSVSLSDRVSSPASKSSIDGVEREVRPFSFSHPLSASNCTITCAPHILPSYILRTTPACL